MAAQKIIIVKMGKVGKSWSIEVVSRSENLLAAIRQAVDHEQNINGYRVWNAANPFEIKKRKQKTQEKPQTVGVAAKALDVPHTIKYHP